jgi:hypothetical protein
MTCSGVSGVDFIANQGQAVFADADEPGLEEWRNDIYVANALNARNQPSSVDWLAKDIGFRPIFEK